MAIKPNPGKVKKEAAKKKKDIVFFKKFNFE
jgi:hypothetical protein